MEHSKEEVERKLLEFDNFLTVLMWFLGFIVLGLGIYAGSFGLAAIGCIFIAAGAWAAVRTYRYVTRQKNGA